MELFAITVLVALVGALAAAFGSDSRLGFGDNREATSNEDD